MITVKKILVPVDFSGRLGGALDWAKSFAQKAKAELIILHCIDWSFEVRKRVGEDILKSKDYESQIKQEINEKLQLLAEKFRGDKLVVSTELTDGKPAIEIVKAVKNSEIDLIVMDTHGRTNSPHLLIGSVAERVARKASCPVLTIKAPEFKYKPI
ncbi:universal stress protein [bacterium]|nr:universal stress protein [bacterium]